MSTGKWIAAGVALGIALVALLMFIPGSKEATTPFPNPSAFSPTDPTPKTTKPSDQKVYPVTISQLNTAFSDNEISAKEWLKGKRLQITGQIFSLQGNAQRWSVALDDANFTTRGRIEWVNFNFTSATSSLGASLHEGQTVTCTGVYDEHNLFRSMESLDFVGDSIQLAQ